MDRSIVINHRLYQVQGYLIQDEYQEALDTSLISAFSPSEAELLYRQWFPYAQRIESRLVGDCSCVLGANLVHQLADMTIKAREIDDVEAKKVLTAKSMAASHGR